MARIRAATVAASLAASHFRIVACATHLFRVLDWDSRVRLVIANNILDVR